VVATWMVTEAMFQGVRRHELLGNLDRPRPSEHVVASRKAGCVERPTVTTGGVAVLLVAGIHVRYAGAHEFVDLSVGLG